MVNGAARYYIVVSALGGLVGLAYAASNLPYSLDIGTLVLLLILGGVAQAAPVSLFYGNSISIASAVSFIALLLFGPSGGILVNLSAAVVHALFPKRREWYKTVFNTSVFTISAGVAGATYALTGGVWPARDLTVAIPTGAAAIVYFAVNTGMIALVVSLTAGGDFRTLFNESHRWLILHHLMAVTMGLMAALGYQSMGWPGLLAFSLPLLMPWASMRMSVAQTKTVLARDADVIEVNAKLAEANSNLRRRIDEMDALYRIGLILNRSLDLDQVLACIVNSVGDLTQAHGVAIFLYDAKRKSLNLASQIGLSDAYLQHPEISLDGPATRAISGRRRFVVHGDPVNLDLLSPSAAREGVVAAACLPLAVGDEVVGALDIAFKEPHTFSENDLTVLETFAELAAAGIHSAQLNEQVHSNYLSTIAALVATVEAKDPYTKGHSEAVRALAMTIGSQMGLSDDDLKTLELAALFHDIGKIGIPENLLGKNGPLTADEWQLVKRHPALAENILKHVPKLAETIPIVRSHHERFDGKGYPDGLSATIPRLAAIIAVADAYDAMTSDRPYRKAMTKEYAVAQVRAGSESQFDPAVVDAFLKAIEPQTEIEPQPISSEIVLMLHSGSTAL